MTCSADTENRRIITLLSHHRASEPRSRFAPVVRQPEITWSYDPGVTETVRDSMTMARAVAEFNTAVGYTSGDLATPRPT